MRQNRLTILRLSFGSAAFLMALAMIQLVVLGFDFEILSRSDRIIALFGLGLGLLGIGFLLTLGLLAATWTRWQGRVAGLFESVGGIFTRLGWFNMVLFAAGIGVYAYLMIGPPQ